MAKHIHIHVGLRKVRDAGFGNRTTYDPREHRRLQDEIDAVEARIKATKAKKTAGKAVSPSELADDERILAKLKAEQSKYTTDAVTPEMYKKGAELLDKWFHGTQNEWGSKTAIREKLRRQLGVSAPDAASIHANWEVTRNKSRDAADPARIEREIAQQQRLIDAAKKNGREPSSNGGARKKKVARDSDKAKDTSKLIVRNTGPDKWHVFKEGYPVAEAGPFKTAAEAAAWIKAHPQGAKGAKDESANAAGKLSPSLEKQIGTEGSAHREEMPANVFLEPASRKYPVKEKEGGEWKWSRKLLLAAAREARMHGDELLAKRADEIRAREFGADI